MGVPRLQHVGTSAWLDIGLEAGAQGGALWTAGTARSTWGPPSIEARGIDRQLESFADIDGVFEIRHGQRERRIVWPGILRMTDVARATILAQRDSFNGLAGEFLYVDIDDTEYGGCVIEPLELGRSGMRMTDPVMGLIWVAPYEIVVRQLAGPSA